jgi:uncharacterized membrane protein
MKKQFVINTSVLLIAISPIIYLLFVWSSVPETFVTKFEFNEAFEKVQSRKALLISTIVLSAASACLYLVMRNLKKIDPKVTDETPTSAFHKLGLFITLFLVTINYFLILSAQNQLIINANVAIAVFGFVVVIIGNYMNNLKPNYVAGIRLPWTLNDPENWRKTHQLAGKLWFAGGIIIIVFSSFLTTQFLFPFVFALLAVIVVVPAIFSYKIYRRKKLLQ